MNNPTINDVLNQLGKVDSFTEYLTTILPQTDSYIDARNYASTLYGKLSKQEYRAFLQELEPYMYNSIHCCCSHDCCGCLCAIYMDFKKISRGKYYLSVTYSFNY